MENLVKVLIADDSRVTAADCATAFRQAGFYAVAVGCDEVLSTALPMRPQIVILSSGTGSGRTIRALKSITDSPPLIIAVTDSRTYEHTYINAGADRCIARPVSPSELVTATLALMLAKREKPCESEHRMRGIEQEITDIIRRIGIPAHIKGYHYIRTAIMLVINDREMISSITGRLYPTVAQLCGTTASRVERAIRHAIGLAWDNGESMEWREYFGSLYTRGKPTNSEFIAVIAERLRVEHSASFHYDTVEQLTLF